MLYESEVRNHIKIEQQLKLHIECVQEKAEDCEKQLKQHAALIEEHAECTNELKRYKDILNLREKEIEKLKRENSTLRKNRINMKQQLSHNASPMTLDRPTNEELRVNYKTYMEGTQSS